MVHKTVRRGVHSGNTLRASNSRFNRQYRRQSCLVRQVKNISKVCTILDDLQITDDDVAYSLNKKARWNVPQVLKQHIATKTEVRDDVKIDLVESHKLKRHSNCIGFYSTKGPVKKVLPKQHTYFNVKSIQKSKNHQKRRSKKRVRGDHSTIDEKENDAPQMTVNVMYPCPSTSSITHNPKYMPTNTLIVDNGQQSDDDTITHNSKPVKGKGGRRRKRINVNGKETSWLLEEYGVDEYNNDSDDFSEDLVDRCIPRNVSVTIEDILNNANRIQELCTNKPKSSSNRPRRENFDTKSQKLYICKEDSSCDQPKPDFGPELKSVVTSMKPVPVCIPAADVRPEILKEKYGQEYKECNCLPRKFIIDISKRVYTSVSRSKAFRNSLICNKDMRTVLVFAYDVLKNLDSTNVDLFNVSMNMKTTCETLQIETLLEYDIMGIEDVIEKSITYIETIPIEYFVTRSYAITSSKGTDFQLLSECCGTKTENYRPKDMFMYDLFTSSDEITSPEKGEFDSFPPEFCNICFETIGDRPATALQSCGHWFCDECWKDHITARLQTRSCMLTCPEFKCSVTVSKPTIATIAHLSLVEKLFHYEQEILVSSDDSRKWCPNPECERILKSTTSGRHVNVTCDCGFEICVDCLGSAHWPVPCDKTTSYWKKLSQGNYVNRLLYMDRLETVSTVRGKCCPTCKQFIEKNGGCFSMYCACGTRFCWGCGKPYDTTHIMTEKCWQNKVGDKIDTEEKEIPHNPDRTKSDSKMFKAAVRSRSKRHPNKTSVLRRQIHSICTKLKMIHGKHAENLGKELQSFEVLHSKGTVTEKIKPFFDSMLKIYSELQYIVEYIAVYLDNEKYAPNKRMLLSHITRLEDLASNIYCVIAMGTKQEVKFIIPSLMQLRHQSKKCISSLATKLRFHVH